MGASKEYFLKLSEEIYNDLDPNEKMYLDQLGMETRQLPTEDDLSNDENYKAMRKQRIASWNEEQKYLFNKRHK
jgi:hypothetical protein